MAKATKQADKIKRDPDGRVKLKKTSAAYYTKSEWDALSIDARLSIIAERIGLIQSSPE